MTIVATINDASIDATIVGSINIDVDDVALAAAAGTSLIGAGSRTLQKALGIVPTLQVGVASDQAAAINAVLNDADVSGVMLQPGIIWVSQPILIPSNKTLFLNGATVKMMDAFAAVSGINSVIGSTLATNVALIGPGTVDANKVGLGGDLEDRKNAVMFSNTEGFICADVVGKNASGYIFFQHGSGTTYKSRGTFARCVAMNGEYHFEQMQPDQVDVIDCRSEDGDGDITCAAFLHPVYNSVGASRTRFINFRAIGTAGSGCEIITDATQVTNDIQFFGCHIETTKAASSGLFISGAGGTKGIRGYGSKFIGDQFGALVSDVTDSNFDGCLFKSEYISFQFQDSAIDFGKTRFESTAPTGVGAFGLINGNGSGDDGSRVRAENCLFVLSSDAAELAADGFGIDLARNTRITRTTGTSVSAGAYTIPNAGNYFVVPGDMNKTLMAAWDANVQIVHIQDDATAPMPIGTIIRVINVSPFNGARYLEINAGSGVTLHDAAGLTDIYVKPRGIAQVEKVAVDTWFVTGDLE